MSRTQNDPSSDAKPETAEPKVRRALEANPGTTTSNLASAAGVGRSTASKILSRWAAEGLVTRTTGKDQSVPVTWTMCDNRADDTAEVAESGDDAAITLEQHTEAAQGDADERETDLVPDAKTDSNRATPEVSAVDAPKNDRLAKGALYELVKGFLSERSGEAFGPAKIGTELGRSSGAVNNALEKLVANGLATKTCEAPKRFMSS